ncbi:peptidoglycan recognition protein family protein [Nocardiopsis chromatogenes]|uniref:peptidoglycan recognition protein family protein n=1 Tax=Nocardiopsis chromatogenes TaxID=280239 RepID=UPI00034D33CD|nr:peptidoglycan recognition family protein [Nocardiopsis chromatogenes]
MAAGAGAAALVLGDRLLGGGAAAAARAVAGESGPPVFPRTGVQRLAATAAPVRPERPFDHVAVVPAGGAARGRARFIGPEGPGPWRPVRVGAHGTDDGREGGALLQAPPGATGYEVEMEGQDAVETAALDTRSGRRRRMSGAAHGLLESDDVPGALPLPYVTRSGWGADEGLRGEVDGGSHPVQVVTVHHAAMPVAEDPRETMRAIYWLHTVENGWADIGYHLLIDPEGTVYEGRATGGPLPVFSGMPLPGSARCVTGAHAVGHNAGNIGICLLGDFTSAMPSRPARDALVRTVRTLCALSGVDPSSRVRYANPVSGASRKVHAVAMHRDWGGTACPGDAFAVRFWEVRDRLSTPVG